MSNADWLERIRCAANIKGQYNQPVNGTCPLKPAFIRWENDEFKVSGFRCQQCGAIFKPGKERQYKPITYKPSIPKAGNG